MQCSGEQPGFGGWPDNEQLTVAAWGVLKPLACRLASVYLGGAILSDNTVVPMGRALGGAVHTVCLDFSAWASNFGFLLASSPHLVVVHARMSREGDSAVGLASLAAACTSAKRHIQVQAGKKFFSEQQAQELSTEWTQITRV